MARLAVCGGMRANQRKTICMLSDGFRLNTPSSHRVTGFTRGAELPSMDIRMTGGARLAHVFEHQLHMATGARDVLMLSEQWISRLPAVIEIRRPADRSPRFRGVAVLTLDFEYAMRVPGPGAALLRVERLNRYPHSQTHQHQGANRSQ